MLLGARDDRLLCALELLEQWSLGALAPVVGATYPLAQAEDALRLVADRRSTGKVVLVP